MMASSRDRMRRILDQMSSMVRKLFKGGRKRKNTKLSSAEEAINQLKDTEELLIKKQQHFEAKIEHEIAIAKANGTKNKRASLAALKRKKLYEKELTRIDGVLTQLEAQRSALENAGMNVEVMGILADANKTLKKANNELNIDKVSDLMDNIAEDLDVSNELANAISRPIADQLEEDDLMGELEKLADELEEEQAVEEKTAKDVPMTFDSLPEVPKQPLERPKKVERQDSGMDELEAWAAAN